MPSVFISYSRKDIKAAKELQQQLKQYGFDVWMDTSTIKTGEQWEKRIRGGIEDCSAFVILVSPRSARSLWVMRELTYALEYEKAIFPLLLEGEPWPLIADLHCAKSNEELIPDLRRLTQLVICRVRETAEDEAFAQWLERELAALGANLIQGERANQQSLNSGGIMLLAVSPEAMKSSEIRTQWEAFDRAGAPIVPMLIRHANVPARLRDKQPYIDFLNQDYGIAFAQLCGVLDTLGVRLKGHNVIAIPPQPPLPLNSVDMLYAAKEEVWMSGLILDVFTRHPGMLNDALNQNPKLRVRLLMLELDVRLANETGTWTGINQPLADQLPFNAEFEAWVSHQEHTLTPEGRWVAQRLFQNQTLLKSIQEQTSGRLEIHTLPHRLGMGYYIIDPRSQHTEGMLTATPYFYQIDYVKATRPVRYNTIPIYLSKNSSKESDLWWFDQYVQEFERLWDHSQSWKPVLPLKTSAYSSEA